MSFLLDEVHFISMLRSFNKLEIVESDVLCHKLNVHVSTLTL